MDLNLVHTYAQLLEPLASSLDAQGIDEYIDYLVQFIQELLEQLVLLI
jgi:hypothetical protein